MVGVASLKAIAVVAAEGALSMMCNVVGQHKREAEDASARDGDTRVRIGTEQRGMDDEMIDERPLSLILVSTDGRRRVLGCLVDGIHQIDKGRGTWQNLLLRLFVHIAHDDNMWRQAHGGNAVGCMQERGAYCIALSLCLLHTSQTAGLVHDKDVQGVGIDELASGMQDLARRTLSGRHWHGEGVMMEQAEG